ncbi:ATP-dependent Lon protease pim1 [Coemansia sp. RSA 2607]|nr:ATP-dependent Lon protease pim1 [Coemansia sp. RSA 2607]
MADEKLSIAQRYLAPQAKEAAGLEGSAVTLSDEAVQVLVRNYCRESGVRNLKKHIEKIFRKAALKIVESGVAVDAVEEKDDASDMEQKEEGAKPRRMSVPSSYSLEISDAALKDYVGPPVFESDRLYEQTPAGVVMGLAWTSMGGSALYIESVVEATVSNGNNGESNGEDDGAGRGRLHTTGQLGDVMKESSVLAYTYVRSLMNRRYPSNKFFNNNIIHLHVPEGATPKDGPSAGVTMTTALLSLALNRPVRADVAMTGELTLTGRVLKIGGLKEKTIAARRSGVTRILFPKANLADWEELPDNVKQGIEGCPIEWYEQIPALVGLD